MSAPVIDDLAVYSSATSATSHVVPAPATTFGKTGLLIVALNSNIGTGSVPSPSGWTLITSHFQSNSHGIFAFVKYGMSATEDVTVTVTASRPLSALFYSLSDATQVFESITFAKRNVGTASTTASGSTITTTSADSLVLDLLNWNAGRTDVTLTTPSFAADSIADSRLLAAHIDVPVRGAVAPAEWSATNSASYVSLRLAIPSASANTLPVVSIAEPVVIIAPGTSAQLTASATDLNGTVASYAWTEANFNPLNLSISGENTPTLTINAALIQQDTACRFEVVAIDDAGGQSDPVSAWVYIQAEAPGKSTPGVSQRIFDNGVWQPATRRLYGNGSWA